MARAKNIPNFNPDHSLGICLAKILAVRVEEMYAYHAHVVNTGNVESVHDMRVAARRLQAMVDLFRKRIPPHTYTTNARMIGKLVRSLGKVRELDVFLQSLGNILSRTSEAEGRRMIRSLILHTREGRNRKMEKLRRDLARIQKGRLQENVFMIAVGLHSVSKGTREISIQTKKEETFRETMKRMLPRFVENVLPRFDSLIDNPGRVEELHELRIKAKPLRYALEVATPAFGRNFGRCLKKFEHAVRSMGTIHDADVAISGFRELLRKRDRNMNAYGAADVQSGKILESVIREECRKRDAVFREFSGMLKAWKRNHFEDTLLSSIV